MRQIALGMLLTAVVAVSASAQTPTTPSSNGALQGVTLSTPVLAASATPAPAQAPAATDGFVTFLRKTELSGTVDGYYTYSTNKPTAGSLIPLRVFDGQHNQFTLALAELALSKPATADDHVGFRLDLDYGPVADAVNAFEPGGSTFRNIQQAYLSYFANTGGGLTLDFGKFVTPIGAEVIEAKDNWNYSRSILFGYAIPFYHTGLRLNYTANDKVSIGGTVTNGWNNSTENNSAKSYGLMATIKAGKDATIVQNYMTGPEQTGNSDDWRNLYDATLTYVASDKLSLMANYDYGHDTVGVTGVSWQGVALYAKAQATPIFAFIPRFEYYKDPDGYTTAFAQTLKELTLTAEVKHSQGLITRFEYRGDWSDGEYFVKESGPVKSQNTFTVAMVYGFSSK